MIQLKNLSLSFPHKTCFEDFSIDILYGNRIAIIGKNGSGKSSLLKMIKAVAADINVGYVPQVIEDFKHLSGGQRFNEALTEALSIGPDLLLLDEPTNHLDVSNRKSLMRMLKTYPGTLIIASHDQELLRRCIDILWHIDNGKIHVFSGNYDDYMQEIKSKRVVIEQEIARLNRQRKDTHQALMKEQVRAAKSKAKGEKNIDQKKWPTVTSKANVLRACETSGHKKADIAYKKENLNERLADLRLPEIIKPKFSLNTTEIANKALVSINDGNLGYGEKIILGNINLSIMSGERLAITGDNGSGKSTLLKAILNDIDIVKSGLWYVPNFEDIGYLDQHYNNLNHDKSALENIHELVPMWEHAEIRRHLNDFLFRKNEEVNALVSNLSGGEKARLSLAQIAAKTPKFLILDEVTNNIDLETRQHVIQVLKDYPGAMIVVSHDEEFLKEIGIEQRLQILSDKTGRTKTYYAREAIINHLQDMEDYYLAEERMAKPSKRWSLEDFLNSKDQ